MFNRKAYENSLPDGFPVLEVAGTPEEKAQPRLFVPLKRSGIFGDVTGPLAALKLTQVFGFSKEQLNRVIEAVYRFPLPGDAAVMRVAVKFGNVEIATELKEREKAEKDYADAKKEGRQAALATRESPDVFTLQVAGIKPDEDVTVETDFVQLAKPEGGGWTLRIPLTTAPRYSRSDEETSRHVQGQPLVLLRDPGHRFSMNLSFKGVASVSCPTHEIATKDEGGVVRIGLKAGEVVPDRDCVLNWTAKTDARSATLDVFLNANEKSEDTYFLALVSPPGDPGASVAAGREVHILVDHSGSMEGAKWEAADWAVRKFLSGLTPLDSFNLCLFHNTTRWFSKKPVKADEVNVEKAVQFLLANKDSGGTELGVTLEETLSMPRGPGVGTRQVLIITDAEVTDAGRILRLADEEFARADHRRISLLCVDAAPNSFLAGSLAERGGGVARFLTSDPEEEDISTALDEVLEDWRQPVLTNLCLMVDGANLESVGRKVIKQSSKGKFGIDLGDLPAGRFVWVAGRVERGADGAVSFRLMDSTGAELASARAEIPANVGGPQAVKALFGAKKLIDLEYVIHGNYIGDELADELRRLGYVPDKLLSKVGKKKVYAENVRKDVSKALNGLLVGESLEYGIICSETAFVAVRTEAGRRIEGTAIVANALPAGWSDQFAAGAVGGAPGGAMMFCSAMPPMASPPAPMPSKSTSVGGGHGAMPPAAQDTDIGAMLCEAAPEPAAPKPLVLFSGVPAFANGECVLFDTTRKEDAKHIASIGKLSALMLSFPGKPAGKIDGKLVLLVFVDDMAMPRAKIKLADVMAQGGKRPLNISLKTGGAVKIVLLDPSGVWAKGAPKMEIGLVV